VECFFVNKFLRTWQLFKCKEVVGIFIVLNHWIFIQWDMKLCVVVLMFLCQSFLQQKSYRQHEKPKRQWMLQMVHCKSIEPRRTRLWKSNKITEKAITNTQLYRDRASSCLERYWQIRETKHRNFSECFLVWKQKRLPFENFQVGLEICFTRHVYYRSRIFTIMN